MGGQDRALGSVAAKRGHLLSVTVADPEALLPAARTAEEGRGLLSERVLVSVSTPVLGFTPLPAQLVPGARRFEMVVPFDTEFPLTVDTGGLLLVDGEGRRANGFSRRIKIDRGVPMNPSFRVTRAPVVPGR